MTITKKTRRGLERLFERAVRGFRSGKYDWTRNQAVATLGRTNGRAVHATCCMIGAMGLEAMKRPAMGDTSLSACRVARALGSPHIYLVPIWVANDNATCLEDAIARCRAALDQVYA